MKRVYVTLAVAALVLLAGCAGLGGGDGSAGGDVSGDLGGDGGGAASGGADGSGGDGAAQAAAVAGQPLQGDRAIVRTGTIRVRVEEFSAARSAVEGHARSLDGYVSGSDATRHTRGEESWRTGHVVVRVPSEQFQDMLAFVRERGTVLEAETQTEDVSDQLVDLRARLTNSQERRDRLRSFYEEAETTNELLNVEDRLSAVQAEIERLQAQLRSLEDRVAYSTIRVRLVEPGGSNTGAVEAGDSSLASAFLGSVSTAVDYLYGTLLFVVRLVPYLVLVGVPIVLVGRLTRRRYGSWRASPVGAVLGVSGSRGSVSSSERTQPPAESGEETDGES